MHINIKGCSTCKPGEEKYENFYSEISKKDLIQYDYRTSDGKLFSCIGISLERCRDKKDKWVKFNNLSFR